MFPGKRESKRFLTPAPAVLKAFLFVGGPRKATRALVRNKADTPARDWAKPRPSNKQTTTRDYDQSTAPIPDYQQTRLAYGGEGALSCAPVIRASAGPRIACWDWT